MQQVIATKKECRLARCTVYYFSKDQPIMNKDTHIHYNSIARVPLPV